DVTVHQLGRERRKARVVVVRPAVFDGDVPAFDITGLTQSVAKGRRIEGISGRRRAVQEAYSWKGRRLSAGGEGRNDRRGADGRQKSTSLHSRFLSILGLPTLGTGAAAA